MKNLIYLLLVFVIIGCNRKKNFWELSSPEGTLKVALQLQSGPEEQGKLFYSVSHNDLTAIEPSMLGIESTTGSFTEELSLIEASAAEEKKDSYTMLTGKRLHNTPVWTEQSFSFRNAEGKEMKLVFRVFDEGVAFRYLLPQNGKDSTTVLKEYTVFDLPTPGVKWIQPYDSLNTWSPAYEHGYLNEIPIGTPSEKTTGWGFPALFHTRGLWILISETGVYEDYCGARLAQNAPEGGYRIKYPGAWENYGMWDAQPSGSLPLETPWRMILVSDNPGDIVESNMVHHLAEPAGIEDQNWIRPGRASWSWWGDHESGRNFEKLKDYIDFAAEMGWEYSLVDAGWHIMEGGSLEELAEYARLKGIDLFIWYNSGGPHTRVMNAGPRDRMFDPEIRQQEMQRISELGIKGIKVDFFQGDKQGTMQLYMDILRDAAEHNLQVVTHGCTLPRGWFRTFPHLLSMEGVRGAELYGWEGFPPEALVLNTIYPFTRNVMGSMDYTPVTFSNYSDQSVRLTSHAHELALSVIFESGIQHFADRIEGFRSVPGKVLEFLKNVPVTWDDTRFLAGYPGKHVVLARKKADLWYIAGINGEKVPKDLNIKLSFQGEGRQKLELITDGEDQYSFDFKSMEIPADSTFKVSLLPGGGFVGKIRNPQLFSWKFHPGLWQIFRIFPADKVDQLLPQVYPQIPGRG